MPIGHSETQLRQEDGSGIALKNASRVLVPANNPISVGKTTFSHLKHSVLQSLSLSVSYKFHVNPSWPLMDPQSAPKYAK